MRAAVRSELLKYFTTRVWWGMAIALFVAGAAFALLFGILFTSETSGRAGGRARRAAVRGRRSRWPTASTPPASPSAIS